MTDGHYDKEVVSENQVTRIAVIPLLLVICTAIATTKIPELSRPHQGFWFMVSDARTDFAMLMSLLFLLRAGAGRWSGGLVGNQGGIGSAALLEFDADLRDRAPVPCTALADSLSTK
jgi:hypothetical protein